MKTMKKILSLVMGLVMALAMSVTAFAAGENYSITIENSVPGHTYEAYQIFAGDLTMKDGNKVLSNITWGSGVDTTNLPTELQDAAAVAKQLTENTMTAAEFAKTVAPYLKADGVKTSNAVTGGYTISGLDAGYYLVKDRDNSLNNADDFYTAVIRVLDEVLTYEVDQILIVEPSDVSALTIEEGKDLCTLVTCTPYGINSHRLLVRGHRVANQTEGIRVTSDAIQIDPLLVAPVVALPMLLALLIVLLVSGKKRKGNGGNQNAKRA